MARSALSSSKLESALRGMHRLRRCLHGLGDVPCFVLRRDEPTGRIEWWELLGDARRLRPFDFEFKFGVQRQRDRYHAENLDTVRRTKRPFNACLYGLSDLYVPLGISEQWTLAFYVGQWLRELPTYERLCGDWRALSSREAVPTDPLFRRWLRCCLEVPVLCREQQEGLAELGLLAVRLGAGAGLQQVNKELNQLRRRAFLPYAVDFNWVESCLDADGLTRPPWGLDDHLDSRVVDELGLELRPSNLGIIALDRRHRDSEQPLRDWVTERALENAAVRLCRRLPNCVAAPVGDGTVLVAMAIPVGLKGKGRPKRFRELLHSLQRALESECRLYTHAGLGEEVLPGEGLGICYRQALQALSDGWLIPREKQVSAAPRELQLLADHLLECLDREELNDVAIAIGRFARLVKACCGANPAAMRVHFQLVIDRATSLLRDKAILSPSRSLALLERWQSELDVLQLPRALVDGFESTMGVIVEQLRYRQKADQRERIEQGKRWLLSHIDTQDPAGELARRTGLAKSSFRRSFRSLEGQSFGAWLLVRRLEEAKRLVSQTNLPIATIASQAGFGTVHSLIRNFKSAFGTTPERARRNHTGH